MHYSHLDGQLAVQAFDGACYVSSLGHAPHLIQIRRALATAGEQFQILPEIQDGSISVKVNEVGRTLYNHHCQVIYDLATMHPTAQLVYSEQFGLLLIKISIDEGFAFSVSNQMVGPCDL